MPKKLLHVVQGSDEWLALRSKCNVSSDAAAMLGLDPRKSREELLRMRATGDVKAFSEWEQINLLDKGHRVEEALRTEAEQRLGVTLTPLTYINGKNLASSDGIDYDDTEKIGLEAKSRNAVLAEYVARDEVPPANWPQLEHALLVCELDKIFFAIGSEDGIELFCWYESVPARRAMLLHGWTKFSEDLANWKHEAKADPVVGRKLPMLPAIVVNVSGEVKSSNVAVWKPQALTFFKTINRDLHTDRDFEDADEAVKFCDKVEAEIAVVKRMVMSQMTPVNDIMTALDEIDAESTRTRLELSKLIVKRKQDKRGEIVTKGQKAVQTHYTLLNQRLGGTYMPAHDADFGTALKGLRSVESMEAAMEHEATRAILKGTAIAENIEKNLALIRSQPPEYSELFPDIAQLARTYAPDQCKAVVEGRILKHQEKQRQARLAEETAQKARDAAKAAAAPVTPAPTQMMQPAQSSQAGMGAPPRDLLGNTTAPSTVPPAMAKALAQVGHRPSDRKIIEAVAVHFNVSFATAVEWIATVDVSTVEDLAEQN